MSHPDRGACSLLAALTLVSLGVFLGQQAGRQNDGRELLSHHVFADSLDETIVRGAEVQRIDETRGLVDAWKGISV